MKSLKEFKENEIKKEKQSKVNGAWGFDMYTTIYEQATAEETGS